MDEVLPGVRNLLKEVEQTMGGVEPTVASLKNTYNSVFLKDEIIELSLVDYQKVEVSNKIAEKVIHELEVNLGGKNSLLIVFSRKLVRIVKNL